jgi:branched-chain amino acid transport system ATP-binding protein
MCSCDGVHLVGRSPDAVRRHGVALVLEGHPILTGLSVRDNLAAAALMHTRREADREIEAALEIFPELRDRLSGAEFVRRAEADGSDRAGHDLAAALSAH